MIDTNQVIIPLFQNNTGLFAIFLFCFSLLKIIPPEWCGFWKFKDDEESKGRAPRITILNWMLHMIVDTLIRSFVISLVSAFGLKNMITLIIFIVTAFDIVNNHQISTPSVTLIAIGIIALYLDKLVETGKEMTLFGSLLHWKKQDTQPQSEANPIK